MSNARNEFTTHPQIRRRRERALDRLQHGRASDEKILAELMGGVTAKSESPFTKTISRLQKAVIRQDQEAVALERKLAQRKQGSAK